MEFISQILTVGILATAAMTATSYIFSYLFHGNFKEPQLLNYLLDKLPTGHARFSREHVIGWVIHFSIGCFFILVIKLLQSHFSISYTLETAIIFGIVAGTIAIAVWNLMFYLHPNPPSIKKSLFYFQLLIAHLVFGAVMVFCLNQFGF